MSTTHNRPAEDTMLTLPGRIAETLSKQIENGELEAGSRIVEAEIAAQFGVSHTPVRDALRILNKSGMVELLPRRGARVMGTNFAKLQSLSETLGALMGLAASQNFANDGPSAGRNLRRATEDDATALRKAAAVRTPDTAGAVVLLAGMTERLAVASGNALLLGIVQQLFANYRVLCRPVLDSPRLRSIAAAWLAFAAPRSKPASGVLMPELYIGTSLATHMPAASALQSQSTSSWYGAPLFADYPEIQEYLESVEEFVAAEVGTHPMLSEQIAARLRELIQGGKLTFGDRLMEIDLARQFLVSRGPVREALRMLDEEGLIKLRPRRGAIVHQLSVRELNEIYDLRLCISCLTARLAAVGPVPVKQWGQLYDAGLSLMSRVAAAEDIPPIVWISLRRALDRLMFGLVGNAIAGRLSQQFENRLATHYVNAAPTKRDLVLRDRRNLKVAILQRDPERAAAAMRQLIGRARKNVLSELGNPATG